jgi:hypothetical protein
MSVWPPPPGDFEVNDGGFVEDVIQEAKFALIAGLCQ